MCVFTMDGIAYPVDVTNLVCKFSVLDTEQTGRTQDGRLYREPIGTFYNYSMTVAPKSNHRADFDAFWEAISKPVASHVCTFPYGQQTLSQRMYVTSGEKALRLLKPEFADWGEVTVNFIATEPQVMP